MNYTIIIPTHNRPELFKNLLFRLSEQNYKKFSLVIIDSSYKFFSNINFNEFNKLQIKNKFYFHSFNNGTSFKRNYGFQFIQNNNIQTEWVIYLDDDIFFENNFLEKLNSKIEKVLINHSKIAAFGIKINQYTKKSNLRNFKIFANILDKSGIYPSTSGKVASSGWHSQHTKINENTNVDWLPTGLLIVNIEYNKIIQFDNFFSEYGYLEDLDFTYSLKKFGNLFYIPDLTVTTNFQDRSDYLFGNNEILNRVYFVKKHNLSKISMATMMTLRMFYSLFLSIFKLNIKMFERFIGNLNGIKNLLFKKLIMNENYHHTQKDLNILIDFSSSIHGGGASFLYDLANSYKQKPGLSVNILSTNVISNLETISKKYYKCPKFILFKIIYLKIFFFFNYKRFDFVVSGTSYNIKNHTIFISQNNISIDKFIINKFYNKQKVRQYFIRKRVLNAVKKSYLTIAPSNNSKNLLLDYGCDANKIKVINNFSYKNRKFNLRKFKKNKIHFLYVSNYAPHKMHLNLIEAFWKLYKKNYSFQLTCVGKWNFTHIKKLIAKSQYAVELKKNNALFMFGEKNRDEIYKLHNSNDIFIFPSICESGSMSLLEAMKSSMPILSSSMSSNLEYANNSAVYFDSLSIDSIESVLINTYNNSQNLNNLAKKSYNDSIKFNSDFVINKYLLCFESK